jgi:hypothetical protein
MQLLLLETDADGNENAVRRLCGGIQNDYGLSVARYGADEGILVGGTTESTTGFAELGGESVSGENDVLLMKLPPCGI